MAATPSGNGLLARAPATAASSTSATPNSTARSIPTTAKACGFARSSTGNGYWIAAADGSVTAFGDAAVLPKVSDFTSAFIA